jgi:hypothetical protein
VYEFRGSPSNLSASWHSIPRKRLNFGLVVVCLAILSFPAWSSTVDVIGIDGAPGTLGLAGSLEALVAREQRPTQTRVSSFQIARLPTLRMRPAVLVEQVAQVAQVMLPVPPAGRGESAGMAGPRTRRQ